MDKEKGTGEGQEAAYQLIVPKAVQKDIRPLPPPLQDQLLTQHFPALQADPHKSAFGNSVPCLSSVGAGCL
jgi:hypothetical protein